MINTVKTLANDSKHDMNGSSCRNADGPAWPFKDGSFVDAAIVVCALGMFGNLDLLFSSLILT